MQIAGNRWLNALLTIVILICLAVVLHILLIGGINIHPDHAGLGLLKVKLTANKLSHPLALLLVLLFLKACLYRPDPVGRLVRGLRRNRRPLMLCCLIAVLAAIPRLWDLGGHSLNSDEILWIERGQQLVYHLRSHEYKKSTAHLGHPGVVPAAMIGASYIYLGRDTSTLSFNLADRVAAARLPIALVGVLTCVLLYALGRLTCGETASFWGAVILALYPSHISLSRVAHIDSSLALFFTLALLCYLAYARFRRLSWKAASAVFFGFALLTKAPGFVIPFILLAWKACLCIRNRKGSLRFWEVSDLGWLGLGLAVYFSLFTKLWYKPEELHWSKFTHFLPPAERLTVLINWLSSLPWLQISCTLVFIIAVAALIRRLKGISPLSWSRAPLILKGLLLILLVLSFIQLFHIPIVDELELASKVYRIEDRGHLKYWMGQLVIYPPRYFYPFMLLVCTPPLVLFLMACGLFRSCAAVVRRGKSAATPLMMLLAPLCFIGVMSLGHKMAYRYISPVLPFLCLLAGTGLTGIIDAVAAWKRGPTAPGPTRRKLNVAAGALLVGVSIVPLVRIAPHYDLYHNVFIGGPAGAARRISVGWGTGTRAAVERIREAARDDDSIYALGLSNEFRFYWAHLKPRPAFDVLINMTKPPGADWLIIPLGHRLRRREEKMLRLAESQPPFHTISICGIDFATIYRLYDAPAVSGETYEAEDLRSDVGETVEDADAGNGLAIEAMPGAGRGMLVYGPYRRYGKGHWRARFVLKAAGTGGDGPVGLASVSRLATADAVGSREIAPGDLRRPGEYREFAVDFRLDRPRRIQFCIETYGTAGLRVDRVEVTRTD